MIEHIKYVMEKAKEEQPFPWQFMGYRQDLVDANENFIIEGEVWGEWASEIIENAPEWLRYLIGEVERTGAINKAIANGAVKAADDVLRLESQVEELQKALEQRNNLLNNTVMAMVIKGDHESAKALTIHIEALKRSETT